MIVYLNGQNELVPMVWCDAQDCRASIGAEPGLDCVTTARKAGWSTRPYKHFCTEHHPTLEPLLPDTDYPEVKDAETK